MAGSTPGVADQTCATISVRVLDGDDTGKEVAGIPLTDALYSSGTEVGQRVTLIRIPPMDGQPAQYQFSDFERRIPLIVITVVFAPAVIIVARWRGFAALLGLGFAGFILVKFMFPALVSGIEPAAGRADRQLGDHVRRPVRRPRLLARAPRPPWSAPCSAW